MTTFKRIVAVVAIITVLGGGSLGVGLSIGFAIGQFYATNANDSSGASSTGASSTIDIIDNYPQLSPLAGEHTGEPSDSPFSFADQYTETLPIEIRVSDITGVVQTVSGSVVSINIEIPANNNFFGRTYNPGSGSGIIFAEDENFVYIATNNHVVYRATRIGVSFDDENEVEANSIGGDWYSDLAVISVPRSALEDKDFHVAVFGDSDKMLVGDEVVAIGNPMGGGQTATRGIISAINRQITVDGRTLDVLQTDAAINPGNSGGALANIRGEVIGINTAKAISFHIEGMGYAIPSNQARAILEQLLEDGTTPRPFLGVTTMQISEDTRRIYAMPSVGLIITFVQPGSPAYEGGLRELDLIIGYNNSPVENIDDLLYGLNQSGVGGSAVIQIYRNSPIGMESVEVTVTIGDANAR